MAMLSSHCFIYFFTVVPFVLHCLSFFSLLSVVIFHIDDRKCILKIRLSLCFQTTLKV